MKLGWLLCLLPFFGNVTNAYYDDLTCPPNNYSFSYWDNNYIIRERIFGTWVGRGVFYNVNPVTLEFSTLFFTDAVLKNFYDPSCGCELTQFWIRFVPSGTPTGPGAGTGIPSGNFTSYVDRYERPHQACLVANNTVQFEQYYTDVQFYSTSVEANIHFNRTTERVQVFEVFRYPEYPLPVRKMMTTYQLYDDDTNSLVVWNAYNLCKVPLDFDPESTDQWPTVCGVVNPPDLAVHRHGNSQQHVHKLWHIGRGLCEEHVLPRHLHKYGKLINHTTFSHL